MNAPLPVIRQFKEAGLKLEQAPSPFGNVRNTHVFGLDIQRGRFRVWQPDHVIVQVQAKDPKMRQVVLTVKEPEATFTLEVTKGMTQPKDKIIRTFKSGGKYAQQMVEVERKTPKETRYFLCGVDERDHPFIAQLPRAATSIGAAHELLKPSELQGVKVKGHGKNSKIRGKKKTVFRQGEWFMLPLNVQERAEVEAFVAKHGCQKGQRLGGRRGRGKPHTADEMVVMSFDKAKTPVVYMRGKLKHVEHDTLDFPYWVKVMRNLEVGGATAGATWVD